MSEYTDQAESDAAATDTNRPVVLHISRGFTAIYLVLGVAILLSAIRWLLDLGLPRFHGRVVTHS